MSPTPTPRPGRPRDPAKDDAALKATLGLLSEMSFYDLRVDEVAARAGVPKSTIYRRWPSLHALVVDAYRMAFPPPELGKSNDALADLDALIDYYLGIFREGQLGRGLPFAGATVMHESGIGEDYREAFVTPYFDSIREVIDRGAESGQFKVQRPAENIASMILGSCVFDMIFRATVTPPEDVKANARALLGVTDAG